MTPTRNPECVDCKAERERRGKPYPQYPRPAPYGGPRSPLCASHNRSRKRLAKAGAHEKRVQREYGLKPGEYGQLYIAQGGQCALGCGATGASRKLSVDHDHKTGLVRGLLCRPCNDLLGHLRDNPERARAVVSYLLAPPAQRLGIEAVHKEMREDG